jgi:hypothetical protein
MPVVALIAYGCSAFAITCFVYVLTSAFWVCSILLLAALAVLAIFSFRSAQSIKDYMGGADSAKRGLILSSLVFVVAVAAGDLNILFLGGTGLVWAATGILVLALFFLLIFGTLGLAHCHSVSVIATNYWRVERGLFLSSLIFTVASALFVFFGESGIWLSFWIVSLPAIMLTMYLYLSEHVILDRTNDFDSFVHDMGESTARNHLGDIPYEALCYFRNLGANIMKTIHAFSLCGLFACTLALTVLYSLPLFVPLAAWGIFAAFLLARILISDRQTGRSVRNLLRAHAETHTT